VERASVPRRTEQAWLWRSKGELSGRNALSLSLSIKTYWWRLGDKVEELYP